MSGEPGEETGKKLDRLIERAEELLAVIKLVAEDLKQFSDSLKPYIRQAAPSTAAPQPAQTAAQTLTVESVQQSFPEDLRNLLSFQEQSGFIVIEPRGFLGSENFARIADVVKKLEGEYISAGKDSHFRIPKQR